MADRTVSHYRVLEKLGEGGMGLVYKAEDTKLGRVVALKFLSSGDPEHKARLLREARAAAALSHPNICTVFEVDEEQGFLAVEYVEGRNLREKIAERPLPVQEALNLAIQIGEGLQAAHERAVVHRDIKPANVIADPQGPSQDHGLWPGAGKGADAAD